MSEPTDFTHLDEPAFLNERAHLRGRLEYTAENARGRTELERLYEAMTDEFLHRARIAWTRGTAILMAPAEAAADAVLVHAGRRGPML
jgi:hypothetical protein